MSCVWLFVFLTMCACAKCCKTPSGETSECVSLYDCPPLLAAFEQRPLPSRVVSYLRQSQCGFEGYVPRVCCKPLPESFERDTEPATTRRPRPAVSSSGGGVDTVSEEDSHLEPESKCGQDNNGDRIYGGQFTDLDEFPWMALLGYRRRDGSLTYQCGGVLLNHRYVMTAAHCVTGAVEQQVGTLATVRLGEYDTQTEVDCLDSQCADPPQETAVQSAYPHPGYSEADKNKQHDIALVRLARRATYSYYVQPICLVNPKQRVEAGIDAYVAGWGKTLNGKNSPVKLKLSVPIFKKNDCVSKYKPLGAQLTDNQICAGGVFLEDTCRGDSGGPLMRTRPDGSWESIGIVSFGYGCGGDGWPGVYTSVANYVDWIKKTMRDTNV